MMIIMISGRLLAVLRYTSYPVLHVLPPNCCLYLYEILDQELTPA